MGKKDKDNKENSMYWALRECTDLPLEMIHRIKGFVPKEDWNRKNVDYFDDPYDHTFLKQFKTRMRDRSFTWPFYKLY